jgi:hypothetical protein
MNKMMKIMMAIAALALVTGAQAQMGWTLQRCREHFGPEFMSPAGDTHYFHVGPFGRGLGEHVYLTFDPDGTVGGIQWVKLDGKAFSEAEVQQRLKKASRVSWTRSADHESGELSRIGEQNGKTIFDANENDNGRGTYFLTITTH